MSYRLLFLLVGTTLSAQLVPSPSRVPRTVELPASGAQIQFRLPAKPNATASKPWRLFPAMKAPVAPVAKPPEPEIKVQSGPCSIPLTNVLRPSSAIPEIPRLRTPDGTYSMKYAPLPAPPCTDK